MFFRGNPLRYVFTLIGMDGYLNMVTNVTAEISKLTYAVFLIHHIVIIRVLNAWRIDSAKKVVVMLGSLTLLILFEAKMLNVVVDYIMGKFHRNKKEFVPR